MSRSKPNIVPGRWKFAHCGVVLAFAFEAGITLAQAYPVKPINFVLPVPPGSIDMAE